MSEALIYSICYAPDTVMHACKSFDNSFKFELGAGFGLGIDGHVGVMDYSLMMVPARDEHNRDGIFKTGVLSGGLTFFDNYGLSGKIKRTAPDDNIYNPYESPYGKTETEFILGAGDAGWNPVTNDLNLEFGGGLYFIVGMDVSVSFDVGNFLREEGLI